jgi:hypothetical protein
MTRIRWQRGVQNACHLRLLFEPFCNGQRIRLMPLQPHIERPKATERKVAIIGTDKRTELLAREPKLGVHRWRAGDRPQHHI